jgi:hypothetical protein
MEDANIEVVLKRAPDDPRINSEAMQAEIGKASKALHQSGIKYSARAMAFDCVGAVGYSLGEFILTLTKDTLPVLGVVVGAWVMPSDFYARGRPQGNRSDHVFYDARDTLVSVCMPPNGVPEVLAARDRTYGTASLPRSPSTAFS